MPEKWHTCMAEMMFVLIYRQEMLCAICTYVSQYLRRRLHEEAK